MSFNATVSVENGRLAVPGADSAGVRVFRGVPFAVPPVGPLRWRPPEAPIPWRGVRPVDAFGANALQHVIFGDIDATIPGMSEDCLYLNIWTPAESGAERLPVLVYVHGGGSATGHGAEPRYDGARLAARGIVFVTFNYRLNAFGYLAHPDLAAESPEGACGNYGLLDQAAALGWVRRNIAAFGGDPDRVTIGGEFAGSQSVSALMASPLAGGLFHGVIGESGALFPPPGGQGIARDAAERLGLDFAASLGAGSIAELRALPAETVLAAVPRDFRFWPVVDGWFLPQSPAEIFAAGKQNDVALLAGWNRNEGFSFDVTRGRGETYEEIVRQRFGADADRIFALYPPDDPHSARELGGDLVIVQSTWAWIEAQTKTGTRPIYRYRFDHEPAAPEGWFGDRPSAAAGAFHAAEIVYALDNLDKVPWRFGEVDRQISAIVSAYWLNFVKSGDPNGEGLPFWPAYRSPDGPVMVLDARPHVGRPENDQRLASLLR